MAAVSDRLPALRSHLSRTRHSDERRTVELIWFPTGGGKTEAYLRSTAFSRSSTAGSATPDDAGVDVLMRYTLRLLTAQQFQRASALICAMEYLADCERAWPTRAYPVLDRDLAGGATTPNRGTTREARSGS